MIRLEHKQPAAAQPVDGTVTLDYDARQKSRQRLGLDDGREAALLLPPGTTLADGDLLRDAAGGVVVRVVAAAESLSVVRCADRRLLNRICYHLGNRHVALEIGADAVAYRHDHVLDAMVAGLGVAVVRSAAAFRPEPGAYDGHPGRAGHDHGHGSQPRGDRGQA